MKLLLLSKREKQLFSTAITTWEKPESSQRIKRKYGLCIGVAMNSFHDRIIFVRFTLNVRCSVYFILVLFIIVYFSSLCLSSHFFNCEVPFRFCVLCSLSQGSSSTWMEKQPFLPLPLDVDFLLEAWFFWSGPNWNALEILFWHLIFRKRNKIYWKGKIRFIESVCTEKKTPPTLKLNQMMK